MSPQKYKVAVIGAGKIAWSVCPALKKASFGITNIISRNIDSAKALARNLKIENYSDDIKTIPPETNLVILSVPDGEIEVLANNLAKLSLNFRKTIFIHLSGVMTVDALLSLYDKSAMTGSIHIMQTFPSRKEVNISKCSVSIEARDYKTQEALLKITEYLNLVPFIVSGDEKILIHLAGVFCSNFMTGNFFAAQNISGQGASTTDIMRNISEQTLTNIMTIGAAKTLSGPIERGDYSSVERHIAAIENLRSRSNSELKKNLKISYLAQSLVLLSTAEEKLGKLTANHEKIGSLIRDELKKLIA